MRTRELLRLPHTNDRRVGALFANAHSAQWDFDRDVDWRIPVATDEPLIDPAWSPFGRTPTFQALPAAVQVYLARRAFGRLLNSLQVGESVAQDVCAKLTLTLREEDYRNHASAQAMDEARHHLVYVRLIEKLNEPLEDIDLATEMLFDAALNAEEPVELVAMEQFLMEHMALEILDGIHRHARNALLRSVIGLIARDEARHVAFGVLFLGEWYARQPRDERIEFARRWLRQVLALLMDRPGRIMSARVLARLREAGVDGAEELTERMLEEQATINQEDIRAAARGHTIHPLLRGARRIGILSNEIIEALNLGRQPLLTGALLGSIDEDRR